MDSTTPCPSTITKALIRVLPFPCTTFPVGCGGRVQSARPVFVEVNDALAPLQDSDHLYPSSSSGKSKNPAASLQKPALTARCLKIVVVTIFKQSHTKVIHLASISHCVLQVSASCPEYPVVVVGLFVLALFPGLQCFFSFISFLIIKKSHFHIPGTSRNLRISEGIAEYLRALSNAFYRQNRSKKLLKTPRF